MVARFALILVGPLLLANAEPTKLIQPSESFCHDPAPSAQPTAVLRVAHREQRSDETQTLPNWFCIITTVAHDDVVVLASPVVMERHQRWQLIHFVRLDWLSRFGQIDWSRAVVDSCSGHARTAAQFLRQHLPRYPAAKDEENPGEKSTIGQARSTTFGA